MSPLQTITEAKIRDPDVSGEVIFERAFEYACSEYIEKRIVSPKIWRVRAEFEGNYGKYKVGFQSRPVGISSKPGAPVRRKWRFCKHPESSGLGITWIREPESFFDMDSIAKILKQKSKKELEQLIVQMISDDPKYLSLLGIEGFDEDGALDDEDEWYEE